MMRLFILISALTFATSALASPTDYICRVKKANSTVTLVTGAARISRAQMKSSNGLIMIVSNNMGYSLELNVFDSNTDKLVLSGNYKLVGLSDEDALKNPLVIRFQSVKNNLEAECTRADNISYSNDGSQSQQKAKDPKVSDAQVKDIKGSSIGTGNIGESNSGATSAH